MAVSSVLAGSYAASSLFGSSNRVNAALRRPAEQLQQEADGARVKLSAFGQIKSAAAGVQSAARALQDSAKISSADEVKKVAEKFVAAFNNERSVLQGATQAGSRGQSAGALSGDGRAQVAATQLQRVADENAPSLKSVGITVQQDGSLAVDSKVLENAFRQDPQTVLQALGSIGRAAETTATRQISATGTVGAAVQNLTNRVQNLDDRQAQAQTRIDQAQQAIDSASRRYGFGVTGANAYSGIFGL